MWAVVSQLLFGLVWLCPVSSSNSLNLNRYNRKTFSEFLFNYLSIISVDLHTESILVLVKHEKIAKRK